jgi:gas vesicle protein
MRIGGAVVLGVIVGAAVVWLWGREMKEYVEETTRGVRTKAAEGVRAVEETAEKALGPVDEFLQDTKEDVSEALRAGQEAIRPGSAARKA